MGTALLIGLVSRALAPMVSRLLGISEAQGCSSSRSTVRIDEPGGHEGKSDPLDAYSAARAALSGAASVVPKLGEGRVRSHSSAPGGPLQRRQSA